MDSISINGFFVAVNRDFDWKIVPNFPSLQNQNYILIFFIIIGFPQKFKDSLLEEKTARVGKQAVLFCCDFGGKLESLILLPIRSLRASAFWRAEQRAPNALWRPLWDLICRI